MPTRVTLIPAYGRDYKSKAEVKAAYNSNVDFIVATFGVPFDGKPINKPQAEEAGYAISIRYSNLRKITEVN